MPRRQIALLLLLPVLALAGACRRPPAGDPAPTPSPGATAPAPAPSTPAAALPSSAAAATSSSPAPAFDVSRLPALVAKLDGESISKAELMERAQAMRAQMQHMGSPAPPDTEEFYRAMLDQLIGARLLLAEAKRRGLTPSEAEVASSLQRLQGSDPAAFARQLAAQGITEKSVRDDVAHNLAIQKLVAADVTPAVKVSAEAERRFYQQDLERMQRPPQVRIRHILVGVPRDATAEQRQQARQKAVALRARIKGGEDFATVARESSDDPGSKASGGLLPWMAKGQSVPPFEQAAFALEPGQLSDVVESPFGFHVLRLEEKREAGTVPFEEAQPQIEQLLSRQQARELLEQKVAALRKAAHVEVLF